MKQKISAALPVAVWGLLVHIFFALVRFSKIWPGEPFQQRPEARNQRNVIHCDQHRWPSIHLQCSDVLVLLCVPLVRKTCYIRITLWIDCSVSEILFRKINDCDEKIFQNIYSRNRSYLLLSKSDEERFGE